MRQASCRDDSWDVRRQVDEGTDEGDVLDAVRENPAGGLSAIVAQPPERHLHRTQRTCRGMSAAPTARSIQPCQHERSKDLQSASRICEHSSERCSTGAGRRSLWGRQREAPPRDRAAIESEHRRTTYGMAPSSCLMVKPVRGEAWQETSVAGQR